ncbi:hypothetical protein [uncultured Enterovirga sp.]
MKIPITWRVCDIGGWTPDPNDSIASDGIADRPVTFGSYSLSVCGLRLK